MPVFAHVSPKYWFAGKDTPIVITGTGFITKANATDSCPATQVWISAPSGEHLLQSSPNVVSSTQITAKVTTAASEPTETATVYLSAPYEQQGPTYETQIANIQAQNVTPNLNPTPEPEYAGFDASGKLTAHLTLGGTFQIGLVTKQADGTIQATPSTYDLVEDFSPTGNDNIDDNALFKGNAVLQYTKPVNNEVVLQATHLGTQQLTIKPNDTNIKPVNITLSVEEPDSLGSSHPEFDDRIYSLADATGVPPQMIKGQIGNESGFNIYAWRYEPFNGTVGDFGYSTNPNDYRTSSKYGGLSFRLPTIGDSVNPGNCVTYATMGNVKVIVNGVPSNSVWSMSPPSAASGTQVTITGNNFGSSQSAVSGVVTVNGVNAAITNWSNQSITAAVPNYDYATHVDHRIQDQNCMGLTKGATFSQKVMEDFVKNGGGGNLMIPNRDPKTGAVLSLRHLEPKDRYVSVYDLFSNNPITAASWVKYAGGPTSLHVQSIQNRTVDFTAQLTLAASYGLIQVTYAHAIDAGWTGNDTTCDAPTKMDPDNLFDTDCNLAHHGSSLGVGTRSCETHFKSTSEPSESQLESDFADAFQFYNRRFGGYGSGVTKNAKHYEPNPTGTIFSTGGQ